MNEPHALLLEQLRISWSLLEYHLRDLGNDECLWRPSVRGLHVRPRNEIWVADWPESESYGIGPPSIAWLTWHIGFWWSMTLDHSFGAGTLEREQVHWPGSARAAIEQITQLHDEWVERIGALSTADLMSEERSHWPLSGKPFIEIALWLNLELMKNAAEIGYCRFLYGVREQQSPGR